MVFPAYNFRKLGNHRAANLVWWCGIPAMLLFYSVALLSTNDIFPKTTYLLTAPYFAAICWIAWKYQRPAIGYHLDQGEEKFSVARVIGLGLLFMLLTGVLFLIFKIFIASIILIALWIL